jgi:hypothetical protein
MKHLWQQYVKNLWPFNHRLRQSVPLSKKAVFHLILSEKRLFY